MWRIFDAVIVNALMYAIELFGPLSFVIRKIARRIYKRAKFIICRRECSCLYPESFESIQTARILSLLSKAQRPTHPLHPIVPHPRPNDRGLFSVPFSKTTRRRRNCFTVFAVIKHANVPID